MGPMLAANASALEMIWTFIACIGAAFALALLLHIWLSYRAVEAWIRRGWARRWGPRHKFVFGFFVGVGLLFLVWLGFVSLGINAMLNAPPPTPDRAAASERGGTILVLLEGALLGFQAVLFWAWVAVGRPTLQAPSEPPTLAELLEASTAAGRELYHAFADDMQMPVSTLDLFAQDHRLPEDVRAASAHALAHLDQAMERARDLHREIKRLGGVP